MSLEIESLNHVSVQTKRLDESRRFYTDVLGAKEITRPNFSFGGAWLYLAGIQIHLIEQGDPAGRGEIDTRGNHFSFVVSDVDAAEERLKQFQVDYKRKLIEDRGIHQIFFQDPDGHTIEVGRYGIIDQ
jgi:catechol 2,3-dioxygenase-like lactoylglutathione lyase family enzyme